MMLRCAAMRTSDPAAALPLVQHVIPAIRLVRIDDEVMEFASSIGPHALRSPDAIHLATALWLGPAVEAMVCYDKRLAQAGAAHGLVVHAPQKVDRL